MDDEKKRRFLKIAVGTCSAGIAVAVGGPIAVAFLDPVHRTTRRDDSSKPYAKLDELHFNIPRKFEVIESRIDAWDRAERKVVGALWLVRRPGDHVDAYSNVCPHLGCPVGFDSDKRVFVCPCHDSAYALADGARLKGPAPRGLDPLPVLIDGGIVSVTYKTLVQNIRDRKEA